MRAVAVFTVALTLCSSAFGQEGSGGGSSSASGFFNPPGTLQYKDHTGAECGIAAYGQGSGAQCVTAQNPVDITYRLAATDACAPDFASDARCPVASWRTARGAVCGVETYNFGTDSVCGVEAEEFWSDWGDDCPSTNDTLTSIVSFDSETRIHRSGFSVTTQTRHQCRGTRPKSCRDAQFGPETFNACEHSSFGAASYSQCQVGWQACRSPTHGEEARTYPACEDAAFGVTFNTCTLTLTNDVVGTWLTTIKGQAEFNIRNVANWAAQIHYIRNDVSGLGCLLSKTENNPLFDGDVAVETEITTKMKELFANLSGSAYVPGSFAGCQSDSVAYNELVCSDANKGTAFCNALQGYQEAFKNLDLIRLDLKQVQGEFMDRNARRISEDVRAFNMGIALEAGFALSAAEQGLKQ